MFSPGSVLITRDEVQASARNSFDARVDAIDQREGRCRISAGGFLVDITLGALVELGIAPGSNVHLLVKAMEVALHPA